MKWLVLVLCFAIMLAPVVWGQAVPPIYIAKVGKFSVDSASYGKFLWSNAKDSSLEILAKDSGGVWVYNADSTKWIHIWSGGIQQSGSEPYRYYFRDSDTNWYLEMIDGVGSNDSLRAKFGPAVDICTVYPSVAGGGGGEVGSLGASVDNELVRFHSTTGDTIQATPANAPTLSDAGLLYVPGGIVGKADSTTDITTMDSISAQRIRTRRVNTDSIGGFAAEANAAVFWTDSIRPDDSGQAKLGAPTYPFAKIYLDTIFLNLNGGWWKINQGDAPGLGEQLTVAGSNTLDWQAAGSTGGEANTASNMAGNGVGVWKDKSGVDLRFKRLFSTSNLLTLADATDSVNLTVNQGNMALSSIGGAVTDAQVPNTITIDAATNASQLGSVAAAEYLRRSGIVPLTGDWAAGLYKVTGLSVLSADSIREARLIKSDSARFDTLWAARIDPDTLDMASQKITAFGNGTTLSGSTLVVQADGDDIAVGASGIKIAQDGATSSQVLKWNGSAWEPADDATGGGGGGGDTSVAVYDSRSTPDDKAYWPSNGTFSFTDLTANAQNLVVGSTTDRVNIRADSGLTIGDTTANGTFAVVLGSKTAFHVMRDSVIADSVFHAKAGGVYAGAHNFSAGTTTFANNDITELEINQGTLDGSEIEDGGLSYVDMGSTTSANWLTKVSDESGTGVLLTTTSAAGTLDFSASSITLAANEIVNADINWPDNYWYWPSGGEILGQRGNATDYVWRSFDFYIGTPPTDTIWMVQDSSFDADADMSVIIPVVLRPPAWATTIDSIYIQRQTSSSDTSVVSADSVVIDTSSTYTSQVISNRDELIDLRSAGSTAIVAAGYNVDVPGANGSKPVKLLLYAKMDVSTWIRWRIGVNYED